MSIINLGLQPLTAGSGLNFNPAGTLNVTVANSIVIAGSGTGAVQLDNDSAAPGASKYYGTDGAGSRGWYSLTSGNVSSAAGTAGQVLVNGTSGSAQTGAITLTLATALVSINSITSVAGQPLVLATGTTGTAATFASATNALTLSQGALNFTGATTITGGAGNMTIVAGTGNSRTLTLQSTTSGGTATTGLVISATQLVTLTNSLTMAGTLTGAAILTGTNSITSAAATDLTLTGNAGASLILANGATGGVGIGGTLTGNASGLKVFGTTASTSTTTGSGIFGGGVGIAGAAVIGGGLDASNSVLTSHTLRFTGTVAGNVLSIYQNTNSRVFSVTSLGGVQAGQLSVPSTAWGSSGIQLQTGASTYTDSSTAGSGTAATAVFASFAAPTLAATNSSVTTTDAATVYIAGAPNAGTNQTITNPWALWVGAGNVKLASTTSASTSLLGALVVGNGSAATSVGIGGGNINAGGTITSGGLITASAGLTVASGQLLTASGAQGWGVTNVTTAAGTTTLTAGTSTTVQVFVGSTTQSVTLPAANALGAGIAVVYVLKNRSSGSITINRAGSNTIDGSTSFILPGGSNNAATLVSDGVGAWNVT